MAAADAFATNVAGLQSPYAHAEAVTPNDGTDLVNVTRALYIGGGAGTLAVTMADGSSATFAGLVTGTVYPIRVKRVLSTGTGATGIIGLS